MILPAFAIPTSVDIFEANLRNFVNDFKYENDCKIDIKHIKQGKFTHRYKLYSMEITDTDLNDNKSNFGEIEAIHIEDNSVKIRLAIYEIKAGGLGITFFGSFCRMCYDTWRRRMSWSDSDLEEAEITYGYVCDIEKAIIDYYDYYGFDEDYHKMGKIYDPIDDPEIEKKRKRLLTILQRRLSPIEEIDDDKSLSSLPKGKEGMSDWRKRRAKLFKRVKDNDPRLTYRDVAKEATIMAYDEIESQWTEDNPGLKAEEKYAEVNAIFWRDYGHGKDEFSRDDVRNDFNVMEWDWLDTR